MKYVIVISIHADPAMAPGYEEWGGTHIYMKELIDGFKERKIKCVMFTRKCMPFKDIEQYNEYCTVIRLSNGNAELIDKNILWQYHEKNLTQIQEFIDMNGKPEIIHSVYWNSGRLAMELGKNNGIKFVHSVISNSIGRVSRGAIEAVSMRAEYERQIYENSEWIICVSDDERNDIIRFYNISSEKIIVAGQHINEAFLLPSRDTNGFPRLCSGLNTKERETISERFNSAYSIQTDEQYWNHKVFTYMGRVAFSKGLENILKGWYLLFKRYGQDCPPLWIAGGSIHEIHLMREAVKTDIPEIDMLERNRAVVWWGYLDSAGLSTVLMKTLALIMHSHYEPGGRVIVEAMAEGVPVIATPYGFGKDYIVNWSNGFLVNYGDTEGLYMRLTHFIHQPYLSDALGQNARRDAKAVIKKWNFIDNHLMAYNWEYEQPSVNEIEPAEYNRFKARKINLFPYYNLSLSENYIKDFILRITKEQVTECVKDEFAAATSDIYNVKTTSRVIVVKRVFTRLRTGPMFNPFDRKRYVLRADKSFGVELNAYNKSESKIFLGYDVTHCLLSLKKLKPIEKTDLDLLRCCLDYIINKRDITSAEEKANFHRIIRSPVKRESDLENVYNMLDDDFPQYYFERSGCFSEIVGWTSAPFILAFNRENFSGSVLQELNDTIGYFSKNASYDPEENLRCINSDIKLKHFLIDDDNLLEMIDFEKTCIGVIETEFADLLYDYWCIQNNSISLLELISLLPPKTNKYKVLSSMAHICFYSIQVISVMQRILPEIEIERLRLILRTAKTFMS